MWNREQRRGFVAVALFLAALAAATATLFFTADPLEETEASGSESRTPLSLVRLEGVIVDALSRRPLAEPTLELIDPSGRADPWWREPDPQAPGQFLVGGVPVGATVLLRATVEGYETIERPIRLAPGDRGALGEVGLRPLRRVAGTVLDPSGHRAPGVLVQLFDEALQPVAETHSDGRGLFDFGRTLVAQPLCLGAHQAAEGWRARQALWMDLSRLGDVRDVPLTMAPIQRATLVWPEDVRELRVDGVGRIGREADRQELDLVPDPHGWAATLLPSGLVQELRMPWPPGPDQPLSALPAPGPSRRLDLSLLDHEGRPLAGATARAEGEGSVRRHHLGDSRGALTLRVPEGSEALVSHRDHARTRTAEDGELRLPAGGVLQLELRDASGAPLPAIAVELGPDTRVTDAEGRAWFESLPLGALPRPVVHHAGHRQTPAPTTTLDDLGDRPRWTLHSFRPQPRRFLLRQVDEDGETRPAGELAARLVFADPYHTLPPVETRSDATGSVAVEDAPPGPGTLFVEDPEGDWREVDFDAAADASFTLSEMALVDRKRP